VTKTIERFSPDTQAAATSTRSRASDRIFFLQQLITGAR
jgi:hypothetical protein